MACFGALYSRGSSPQITKSYFCIDGRVARQLLSLISALEENL